MSTLTRPANRPRRSLRRALLTASLVLALAPMLGLSLLLGLRQNDDSRNQAVELLTSVAVLKEAEIRTWFNSLSPQLVLLTATPRTNADFLTLIDQPAATRRSTTPQRSSVLATFAALLDSGIFQEVFLMDAAGAVVISTRPEREGQSFATQPFFQRGRQRAYTQSPFYSLLHDRMIVYAAAPVHQSDRLSGANTDARGVLVGVTNLDTLSGIMRERGGLGETGETYLVSSDFIMLTEARRPLTNRLAAVRTVGAYAALAGRNGWALYDNFEYPPLPVVGVYRWIPELDVALLAEQSQAEAFASSVDNVWLTIGVTLIVAVLAAIAVVVVSRNLARPIEQLTDTARRMARGDLNQSAALKRADEIGELAEAFDLMAGQLHKLIEGL
ncbi:MAG: HAMP domain-containing protein [Chloroflexi bacterium]|nr:HAMP domain-containing protein [Chloroflexota bacterium]